MTIFTKVLPMLHWMRVGFVAGLAVGVTVGVCAGVGGTVAVVMITRANERTQAERDD